VGQGKVGDANEADATECAEDDDEETSLADACIQASKSK